MAQQTRWTRGEFCWYELGTTDVDAAKSFYGSLFGWTTMDVPMGPMGIYTLLKPDGPALAGPPAPQGRHAPGAPPRGGGGQRGTPRQNRTPMGGSASARGAG